MDKDERPLLMLVQNDYPADQNMVFIFENGKGVRIPITAYETKSNRRKLTGAFSKTSPVMAIFREKEKEPFDIMMVSDLDRAIVFKSSLIPLMTTRSSGGVTLQSFGRKEKKIKEVIAPLDDRQEQKGYRRYKLPATGTLLSEKDISAMQLSMDDSL